MVLVSLVMPGCDDSDEAPATGGGGFQPLASKLIRAADGGTVVVEPPHEIAGTSITIPAGALAADTVISINTATPSLHPSGVSLIVDIGPDGTLFSSPAVVKVVYDPASLPPGAVASSLTLAELCVGGLAVPLANVTVDVGASSVSGETSNLSDFVVTTPVLADARVDQEVTVGDTVTLDGSASTGTRSNPPLAFRWELTERPAASSATLSNPKATAPSFTADLEGLYVARLTVDDGFSVDTDVVQVVALPADTGPVPDEPGPGTGDEDGQTCTVSTTVSPSEGSIRTAWSPIPILEQTATGVIIDGVGTGPVRIFGSNDGVTCQLDNRPMWAFAVGDDLDVSLDSSYAAQNFGGFPVMSGFGDWSDKSQYCVKVENPTDHEVFVQLQAFTSQAQSGAGRFVRSFVTNEGVWVPARTVDDMMNVTDGLAVVCMDLDNAFDEAGNPTAVPNDANVSGFGMIVGAFPANRDESCRRCALCRICDDDPMTDAPDCPMNPGCPTDNTTARQNQCQDQDRDCIAASRESDTVTIFVSQPAPNIVIDLDPGTNGIQAPGSMTALDFQGGETKEVGIENTGLGPLTLDLKFSGADADQFEVVGPSTLAAGDSTVVQVRYAPDEITPEGQPHTATFEINSDDPDRCSTSIGVEGSTSTILRFNIMGLRPQFSACVEFVVLAPPDELLSVGTRVGYNPAELELVGIQRGKDLIITPAVPDDPATEDVDESMPEVSWEIVLEDNDTTNGVISLVGFDLEGAPIALGSMTGDILELFCLNFRFIDPPACDQRISSDLTFASGPRDAFFPNFDQYMTSPPPRTGQPVETEITSLVAREARFAANEFVRGDVDFDGFLNQQDALLAVALLFDPDIMLDRDCPAALDANNDGDHNFLDAVTIIQTASGNADVQPADPFPTADSARTSGDNKNSELPCNEGLGCELNPPP